MNNQAYKYCIRQDKFLFNFLQIDIIQNNDHQLTTWRYAPCKVNKRYFVFYTNSGQEAPNGAIKYAINSS